MESPNRRQPKQCEQRRQRRQHSAQTMLICCFILAISGYFFWSTGLAAFSGSFPDTSQQGIISPAVLQPVMPSRYPANPTVRDPFAVPKEFQPVAVVPTVPPTASVQHPVAPPPTMSEISLELVGVVSGGGQQVAIVKKAGVSRSYQIKDYIGPYQLLSVGENSATIWGPQGRKVLVLER